MNSKKNQKLYNMEPKELKNLMDPSSVQALVKSEFDGSDSDQNIPNSICLISNIKEETAVGDPGGWVLAKRTCITTIVKEDCMNIEQIFPDQPKPVVKVETSEAASNEWYGVKNRGHTMKKEELDIKEEKLEKGENSNHEHTDGRVQNHRQYNNRASQTINVNMGYGSGSVNNSNMFQCDQCAYQVMYKSQFNIHLLRHKDPCEVNMLKCDHCAFQTKFKSSLNRHRLQHKKRLGVNMFQCDQCAYQTVYKHYFTKHILRHRDPVEVNMLKCDHCAFETKFKSSLNVHFLQHKDPLENNLFQCDHCAYQTVHKHLLIKHILRHRDPEKNNMLKCDYCAFETKLKSSLSIHLLEHKSPAEVNTFKCDQCAYQTVYTHYLANHAHWQRDLEKVNMFKCNQCANQAMHKPKN